MQKINNKQVKDIMYSLGADLCGVASIEWFEDAPEGIAGMGYIVS